MVELKNFVGQIDQFYKKQQSEQIIFFAFYLLEKREYETINSRDIQECFKLLKIPPYSNISAFLNKKSKKTKNKECVFIKSKEGFILTANTIHEIQDLLSIPTEQNPSNTLITLEIFDNTRGYLINCAKESALCYDFGQYNACLIMMRKLLETLIIELFEKHNIKNIIMDQNREYLQLSYLIEKLLNESSWSISRNTKKSIPEIKKFADLAAHNRRFFAKKNDVDKIKIDLRIVLQELLTLIDY